MSPTIHGIAFFVLLLACASAAADPSAGDGAGGSEWDRRAMSALAHLAADMCWQSRTCAMRFATDRPALLEQDIRSMFASHGITGNLSLALFCLASVAVPDVDRSLCDGSGSAAQLLLGLVSVMPLACVSVDDISALKYAESITASAYIVTVVSALIFVSIAVVYISHSKLLSKLSSK